jgi:hypothetical protein
MTTIRERLNILSKRTRDWKVICFAYAAVGSVYIYYYPLLLLFSGTAADAILKNPDGTFSDYLTYSLLLGLPMLGMIGIILLGRVKNSPAQRWHRVPRTALLTFFACLSLLAYAVCTVEVARDFQGLFNRAHRQLAFFNSQIWVVSVVMAQTVSCVTIHYWRDLSRLNKFLGVVLIGAIVLIDFVLLGGRRYSLPVILYFVYRSGLLSLELRRWYNAVLFGAFCLMLFLFGGAREFVIKGEERYATMRNVVSLTSESNEFQEIGNGIDNMTHLTYLTGFENGRTYLLSPYIFVPRALWSGKPVSLTFVAGAMISPFAEAYLNFGHFGVLVVCLGFGAVALLATGGRDSFASCCLLAFVFDQMRTGFAELIYTAALIAAIHWLCTRKIALAAPPRR